MLMSAMAGVVGTIPGFMIPGITVHGIIVRTIIHPGIAHIGALAGVGAVSTPAFMIPGITVAAIGDAGIMVMVDIMAVAAIMVTIIVRIIGIRPVGQQQPTIVAAAVVLPAIVLQDVIRQLRHVARPGQLPVVLRAEAHPCDLRAHLPDVVLR